MLPPRGIVVVLGAFFLALAGAVVLTGVLPADAAFRAGWRVRLWDFVFYASFGVVVTSSVRVAGVLLVFSYLIVPALAGTALGGSVATRLIIGWSFGISLTAFVFGVMLTRGERK